MSIRLRLTLWYSFVLAALLIVLDVSIYSILSNNLRANVDTQLNDTAAKILGASEAQSFADILQVVLPEDLDIFRSSDIGILVINQEHDVVRRSSNVSTVNQPFDPDGLTVSKPPIYTTHDVLFAGAHLRVLTVPILVGNRLAGYLQVGGLLQGVDESLRQLSSILLIAGVFGVLAAALVGAFLARQALRPIDRITQTALSIARAGDLDKRIPALGPPDEVGRLTETFNLMLDRLAGLFQAQQRFTADISHELRTPLTTIRGNVDLLKRFGGADPASLEAIRGETDRMIRLVGDLLLLAQADNGLPMRQEPVDLEHLASEVVRQLQVIAGGVNVSLQTGPGEPVGVSGDPDRLRQLVLNLVDNAIKYTPAGGEVKVRVQCEGDQARLDVSDTGPGIPPEHLKPGPGDVPLIFERFYRVEKSRSRAAGTANSNGRPGSGTGLGLSIARWIVQAHAGQIDVQSEVGKGTTFTVWLPQHPPRAQPMKLTLPDSDKESQVEA